MTTDENPKSPENRDDDDDPTGGRDNPFGVFPLVMILVLVVGGLFVIFELRDMASIQDCASSGRRNCAPIELR